VPNGTYEVRLHFAEIFWTDPGRRIFSVTAEGLPAVTDLDMVATVGAATALVRTATRTVTDGALTLTFTATADQPKVSAIEVVAAAPTNLAPVVNAGADRNITLPTNTVAVSGTATDDGLPAPATLTTTWSLVTGPAAVTFTAPTALATTATFTTAGTYTLRLTGNDGVLASTDDLTVTVSAAPTNLAPVVNAGADRNLTLPTNAVALSGTATDDGLPAPATLTTTWSLVTGPAAVTFTAPTALATTATFTTAGTYTLRLTGNDGVLASADDLTVTVTAAPTNLAPVVNAGPDRTITLPLSVLALSGTATDDGLPTPVTLTTTWALVTGPGPVTIASPSALATTSTFTTAGNYTLRLTANDGALTTFDDFVVIVQSAPDIGPIRINVGGLAYTDTTGQVWGADQYFVGGNTYETPANADIGGTVEDPLYRSERWGTFSYRVPVPNGTYEVHLHFAEIYWTSAGQRVFSVTAEGQSTVSDLDLVANVGTNTALIREFEVEVNDGVLDLDFLATVDSANLSALEIHPPHVDEGDHGFLHVVIAAPAYVVDYQNSGSVNVVLRGDESHTHELGRSLIERVWKDGATVIGNGTTINAPLSVGSHALSLTIVDDNAPPQSLTGAVVLPVYPIHAVGGVLAQYFPAGSIPIASLIDALPSQPGFVEVLPSGRVDPVVGKLGGSSYTSNAVVSLRTMYEVTTPGTYEFVLSGGSATRVFLAGTPVIAPIVLGVGTHLLEARFAVPDATFLPAVVMVSINGSATTPIPTTALHHDETLERPFINSMPASGSSLGGESVTINGFGFFPSAAVTVHWGNSNLPPSSVNYTGTGITLVTPPGTGTETVSIETPNGTSNQVTYTYTTAVPIAFGAPQSVATPANPTRAAWGPDGRLYVTTIAGAIIAYTFDDNYSVTATQTLAGVSGLPNGTILGIAFNPLDPPNPVRVYIAHTSLFANGGTCFTGPSPYPGQVSRLDGPDFSSVTPVVTGLPTSNYDHGVNGLVFENNGDLLIAQSGNTNAGVAGNCSLGQLPESPLSGAILRAHLSKPGFNGAVTYRVSSTGAANNDQMSGEVVDVAPGVDVTVLAAGFRNPFDLVQTTEGHLYGTDNGPNAGFGAASTSATTAGLEPTAPDEVVRLVEGGYYGHPNRNRGRYAPRENVYRGPVDPAILGQYTAPLITLPSSSNGIDEYRATTFGSAMRGSLVVQKLDGALYLAELSADRTAVTSFRTIANPVGLDVVTGPGGAIVTIDYGGSDIKVLRPNDVGAPAVAAYDIFPWRGRTDGLTPFVIGGVGFGSAGGTTVMVGGVPATLTSVSPTRIRGLVPARSGATADLVDVVVQSAGQTSTITRAFRYLPSPHSGEGTWESAPPLPQVLGRVAGGVIDGVLYMVGEGAAATFAFDLATATWQTSAPRPYIGGSHAAEVIGGKLYLFGGLGGNSEGRVQIFNPATNSWSLGAPAPFASGAASTAVINGQVYLAGGITGNVTITTAARYNPTLNTWTSIAAMPAARNHAASGTDGQRLYVFGGRGPGSGDGDFVAEGFADVQIYNPSTNTWQCSCDPGSSIPPLPQKRGGMGKAAFHGGAFYVIGGETILSGTGHIAGNYNRVDVYRPDTATWRLDAPMPTARHGIFPLVYDGRIWVAGGRVQSSNSAVDVMETFRR
jgi:hypothetical protein